MWKTGVALRSPAARQPFCRFNPKPFSVAPAILPARQQKGTPLLPYRRCTTNHPPLLCKRTPALQYAHAVHLAPGTGRAAGFAAVPPPASTACKGVAIGALCRRLFCGALPGRAGQSFPFGTGAMLKTFWARLFLPRFLQPRPAGTICLCWGNNQPHPNIGGQVPCKAADMVLV